MAWEGFLGHRSQRGPIQPDVLELVALVWVPTAQLWGWGQAFAAIAAQVGLSLDQMRTGPWGLNFLARVGPGMLWPRVVPGHALGLLWHSLWYC